MIITLSSLKGGSGKSTLAIHLAHAIAQSNRRVLLVDADPQGSAQGWASAREDKPPFTVIGMARNTLHRDLPDISQDYDHVLIDTPPRVSALARTAILAADLVLIPVQPSSYDVWAASETVTLIDEAKGFKPDIKAAFVINRRIPNTVIGRDVEEALSEYEIPTLKQAIAQRVAFSEASSGYTVMEMSATSSASKEIGKLVKEVLSLMEVKSW
ncbi:ParA family partition ATPase [[Limnothrix rosea] IAM M-220]|uniref:ParA family partition ATPase n=1 Tax=[Limnothrix rosea] IAM M-220 TaxID=454133 RepID=UPI000967C7C4|nr:ParA family partition ATPase [[Limnothrix rosea] IAM M-220]OKH11172.1 cobyrinic acid a,c-diamide synthase [[Limnothrix rosea] IAM M-220]